MYKNSLKQDYHRGTYEKVLHVFVYGVIKLRTSKVFSKRIFETKEQLKSCMVASN